MNKVAKFSNGHTDTYKGRRDVKAAWMITHAETGEVLSSGHSLDVIKAGKTAEGKRRDVMFYAAEVSGIRNGQHLVSLDRWWRFAWPSEYLAARYKEARAMGYSGRATQQSIKKFLRDHNAALTAKFLPLTQVEIVEI